MARQYAPLYTNIWHDEEFKALTDGAQRLYIVALSQQNTSWCGVVSFTAKRWATFSKDSTPRKVMQAVNELVGAGYVLLDEKTEELWIRSFIKHNNVDSQPKLVAAAKRQFGEVHSQAIRMAMAKAYPGLTDTPSQGLPMTSVLGVEDEVSGVKDEEQLPTEHLTPTPEVLAEYQAEAERECAAWLKREPGHIVSRTGWIATRVKTLTKVYGGEPIPKHEPRSIGPVCPEADCREGWNLAGNEPVPCLVCGIRMESA